MCTAAACTAGDLYFGRTLDYDCAYGEEIVVTPRGYALELGGPAPLKSRWAMIGMAHVAAQTPGGPAWPLYYEAANEKGLCIAGLNLAASAAYAAPLPGRENIAPWQLIPWLLGQCASLAEARGPLARLNLIDAPFSPALPTARLHWLIADKTGAVVLESTAAGLKLYENPVGVLTNEPPFDQQLILLAGYRQLTAGPPETRFAPGLTLPEYSRGMGAIGLPGDLSSPSRFARAAFVKLNSVWGETEQDKVGQFFHILGAVEQPRGCCRLENGCQEITLYTCCCNAGRGVYYYTTYGNRQITAVDMHRADLDGPALTRYAPVASEQIRWQN